MRCVVQAMSNHLVTANINMGSQIPTIQSCYLVICIGYMLIRKEQLEFSDVNSVMHSIFCYLK